LYDNCGLGAKHEVAGGFNRDPRRAGSARPMRDETAVIAFVNISDRLVKPLGNQVIGSHA